MTLLQRLATAQQRQRSMLCIGLDPEPAKFPLPWRGDPQRLFDFCAAVVDATHDLAIAYKPQIAYFAAHGAEAQLERLIAHIRRAAPEVPVILDAKRGDIGTTAEQYAAEAFERYAADAVTLSPYMGLDSLEPFLRHDGRGVFLLCRTSNPGGDDLQSLVLDGGERLYERVARLAAGPWNHGGRVGLVVGATYPDELARVRAIALQLPLLIPGIGAQGGDVVATMAAALGAEPASAMAGRIVVNSSRAILYASAGEDFAQAAREAAIATRALLNAAVSAEPGS